MDKRDSWEARRAALNHDWFTSFRVDLEVLLNIARGLVDNPTFDFRAVATDWNRHEAELRGLVEEYSSQMGPTRLFRTGILANCAEDTRAWLEPLCQCLWEARVNTAALVKTFAEAMDRAGQCCRCVIETTDRARQDDDVSVTPCLESFAQACIAVSRAVAAFPSVIFLPSAPVSRGKRLTDF